MGIPKPEITHATRVYKNHASTHSAQKFNFSPPFLENGNPEKFSHANSRQNKFPANKFLPIRYTQVYSGHLMRARPNTLCSQYFKQHTRHIPPCYPSDMDFSDTALIITHAKIKSQLLETLFFKFIILYTLCTKVPRTFPLHFWLNHGLFKPFAISYSFCTPLSKSHSFTSHIPNYPHTHIPIFLKIL